MTSPAVTNLITTYHELNPSTIDTLTTQPTSLEFMRHVARNRPFVVRAGATNWPAHQRWTPQHLLAALGNSPINVAITPNGNADSIAVNAENGEKCFVKPLEELEPFDQFLTYIQAQEKAGDVDRVRREVKYAQTQNDNLRNGEFSLLYEDVEPDILWASTALQTPPDAVNLWIGNSRSVTALHRDNYENIYVQVIGRKHFVLLPPVEMPCVNERIFPQARYVRVTGDNAPTTLSIKSDEDSEPIPFASWDPDTPEEDGTVFSSRSCPMRVSLEAGDMLYLPALWYHKVSQSCGKEGICVAVNYWYDMDFGGYLYSGSEFVRNVTTGLADGSTRP